MSRLLRSFRRGTSAALLAVLWSGTPLSAEQFGDFTYRILTNDTVEITDYPTDVGGVVAIPSEIAGKPVTRIGDRAFRLCTLVTGLSFDTPVQLTHIGTHAFWDCRNLNQVVLPEGLESIGDSAFLGCQALNTPVIPSTLTTIGNEAFRGCRAMTSFPQFPPGVTTLGDRCFLACYSFQTATIPDNIVHIGESAFESCIGLTRVTLGSGVRSLGVGAFQYSDRLVRIYLNEGLRSIGDRAFQGCDQLQGVTLPASLTTLGVEPFKRCDLMTSANVSPGSRHFASIEGVLFNASLTRLLFYPPVKPDPTYWIPSAVTEIAQSSFLNANALLEVYIPPNVTSVGTTAFWADQLTTVYFLGPSPEVGVSVFRHDRIDTVYLADTYRWPSPLENWSSLLPKTQILSDPVQKRSLWLQSHGIDPATPNDQDLRGDGVTLLMAYALNLNPNLSLLGQLPQPVHDRDELTLTFYAPRFELTYGAETGTDLQSWSDVGVTISLPDAFGRLTATVDGSDPTRYLRLVVRE